MIATAEQPGWQDETIRLIRQIDPDAGPLYPCDMRGAGVAPGDVLGCFDATFDLSMRETLKAEQRWTGRGACFLVDGSGVEESFRQSCIPAADARRKILAAAIHEYSHFLEARPVISEASADRIIAQYPEALCLLALPTQLSVTWPTAPWEGHAATFGRIAIHLWFRAVEAGWDFHPNDIYPSSDYYALLGPLHFVEALGDEPRKRLKDSLRAIVNSPLPAEYQNFCESEISRARTELTARRQQQPTKEKP